MTANQHNPEPPLVEGGQGRTSSEIRDSGAAVGFLGAIAFSLAVWACIAWACGFFN